MKKACILFGIPKKNSNTYKLTLPFLDELKQQGHVYETHWLYEKNIKPCCGCCTCQNIFSEFGCPYPDDLNAITNSILESDLIVLSSPIYSWYCTPPMKALLDRLVYGMNKYYGNQKKLPLWAGKEVAIITTCGYETNYGADLWETGIKRYCKHSKLDYRGMLVERHIGYDTVFMDQNKEIRAREFARNIIEHE